MISHSIAVFREIFNSKAFPVLSYVFIMQTGTTYLSLTKKALWSLNTKKVCKKTTGTFYENASLDS